MASAADLAKLPELRIEQQNAEFARAWLGELRREFLFTKTKLFNTVRMSFVTTKRFVERDIPCATVEGLILTKLYALPSCIGKDDSTRLEFTNKSPSNLSVSGRPLEHELLLMAVPELAKTRRSPMDLLQRGRR
jgi:hypothetical protein